MKRVVVSIASALVLLYMATWLIGVPAVRRDLPKLLEAQILGLTRPSETRTVIAEFSFELGARYFPVETRTVFWFCTGAKVVETRRA